MKWSIDFVDSRIERGIDILTIQALDLIFAVRQAGRQRLHPPFYELLRGIRHLDDTQPRECAGAN
jgi:hypothetical protein